MSLKDQDLGLEGFSSPSSVEGLSEPESTESGVIRPERLEATQADGWDILASTLRRAASALSVRRRFVTEYDKVRDKTPVRAILHMLTCAELDSERKLVAEVLADVLEASMKKDSH